MAFQTGFMLGFSLIMAIGAQNLFIIKQGVKREYSYYCAAVCFFADSLLVILSLTSIRLILDKYPVLTNVLVAIAVVFLVGYGLMSIRNGLMNKSLATQIASKNDNNRRASLLKITILALSFSLLNPHAILDMFIIIGATASDFTSTARYYFGLGVITSSFIWFAALTIMARHLSHILYKKSVWKFFEITSGTIMIIIAISLLLN